MRYDIVYSRHDGGYYAEVYDITSGKTVYTTTVYTSKDGARNAAAAFIYRKSSR